MPVLFTDQVRLSNMLKMEFKEEVGFCRTVVTVNEATAKNYVVGTVLGKVTAGGKYKIAVESAVDGSKVFGAIVLENVAIPATTDVKLVVLTRGPASVSLGGLAIDATYNDATKLGVLYAAMEAANIQILDKSA